MAKSRTVAGLKLAGLTVAAGWGFVGWLHAPIVGIATVRGWWVVGAVVAAILGAMGARFIGGWALVGASTTIGLVAGAAWDAFWFNDVRLGFVDSLVAGLELYGAEAIAPATLAAFAGALVVGRKRREGQRAAARARQHDG